MAQRQGTRPQGFFLPTARSAQVRVGRGLERRCGRFPLAQPRAPGAAAITTKGIGSRIGSGRTPRKLSGNCHPLADADPTCRSRAWGRRFLGLQPPSRSSPRSQVPGSKEVNRESPGEPGSPAGGPAPGRGTSARHAGTSQRPGAEERAAHEGSGTGAQGGRRGEPCKGRERRAWAGQGLPQAPPRPPRPAGGRGTQ